jgi:hypothetical protein
MRDIDQRLNTYADDVTGTRLAPVGDIIRRGRRRRAVYAASTAAVAGTLAIGAVLLVGPALHSRPPAAGAPHSSGSQLPATAETHPAESGGPLVTVYRYTCCAAADVDRVYHPGDTVVLHWSAVARPTHAHDGRVSLGAGMSGPFPDAASVKSLAPLHDGQSAVKLAATPVDVSLSAGGSPVSRIRIPRGTPPGYYDLGTTEEPATGDPCWAARDCEHQIVSGASIVRVSD